MSACLEAYRATGDDHWRTRAWSAFNWFLGDNDLKVALYDRPQAAVETDFILTGPTRTRGRSRRSPS